MPGEKQLDTVTEQATSARTTAPVIGDPLTIRRNFDMAFQINPAERNSAAISGSVEQGLVRAGADAETAHAAGAMSFEFHADMTFLAPLTRLLYQLQNGTASEQSLQALRDHDEGVFINSVDTASATSSYVLTQFLPNLTPEKREELNSHIYESIDWEFVRSLTSPEEQRRVIEQATRKALREFLSENGMHLNQEEFASVTTVLSQGIIASIRNVDINTMEKLWDSRSMDEFMSVVSTYITPREYNAVRFNLEVPQMSSLGMEMSSIQIMMEQYFQQLDAEGRRRTKEEKEFEGYATEMERMSGQAEEAKQKFVVELSEAEDHAGLDFLARAFGPNGCSAGEWKQFWNGNGNHEVALMRLEAFRESVKSTVRSAA